MEEGDDKGLRRQVILVEAEGARHFHLAEEMLRGTMIAVFKYLNCCHKEESRTQTSELKLQQIIFRLEIRKTYSLLEQ